MNAIIPAAANALVPHDMDQAIRLAQVMAGSKMVPKHLQSDTGTCLMIVEQAMRWQMSPFAVAQCTAAIGGKLVFEGKLVAAAVETSGAIEGHLDYTFAGDGDDRQVTVSARRRGESNPRQMTIRLRDVRTTNEHWKKQPDQMLVYSGTRNWARRFTPAVILGVYSPEEFSRDGKPTEEFAGPTIEATPTLTEREQINKTVPIIETKKVTLREWLDDFEARCQAANTEEVADAILKEERVLKLDDPDLGINESVRQRALRARRAMVDRIWAQEPDADAADEPVDEEMPA